MKQWKYKKNLALGHDAEGKRIRKWVYGNTLDELNEAINKAKKEMACAGAPNINFKTFSDNWLETYKSNKEVNTIAAYRNAINKCTGIFSLKIKDIRKSDLQRIVNQNSDRPETCRKICLTLRQIFDAAIEDGIIENNPAAKLEAPKHKAKEKKSLTEAEREAIKTADLRDQDKLFLDILYYCGLRRGEALALTRSDFDFKRLLLTVNKSIAYDGESPKLKDTKTHIARYVPIPQAKAETWKETLRSMPFIIFSRNGAHFTKSVYRRMLERIQKSINLNLGGTGTLVVIHLTPHMIRHDYATRLYYVPGISPKKKAEILGHSERLFLELYSHIDEQAELLDTFQKSMNF